MPYVGPAQQVAADDEARVPELAAVRRVVARPRGEDRRVGPPGQLGPDPERGRLGEPAPGFRDRRSPVPGRVEDLLPPVDVEARPRPRTPTTRAPHQLHDRDEQERAEHQSGGREQQAEDDLPRRPGRPCRSVRVGRPLGWADLAVLAPGRLGDLVRDEVTGVGQRRRLALGGDARGDVARRVEGAPRAVVELQLHPGGHVAVVDQPALPRLRTGDHARRRRRGGTRRAP